jgi:hypothetical protein
MVPLASLWLPILLSAILVFIASAIMHMVLGYHASDFQAVPREAEVMEALRPFNIPPGDYVMPHGGSPAAMKEPAYQEKLNKGPVALMTVMPTGPITMGANFAQWFVYLVIVSVVAAYVAGRALGPGAPYLEVFRFVGTTAFAGYSLALIQDSIWHKRKWSTTAKMMFDGLVFALLTAGVFGWRWPNA